MGLPLPYTLGPYIHYCFYIFVLLLLAPYFANTVRSVVRIEWYDALMNRAWTANSPNATPNATFAVCI